MKKIYPLIFALFIWNLSIAQDSCDVVIEPVFNFGLPGAILTAITDGQQDYDYEWSTGDSIETIFVVDAGTYCVTITGDDGCVGASCLTFTGTGQDSLCFADIWQYYDSAGIILEAFLYDDIFGPAPDSLYSYLWSTGETTPIITITDAGEYCVTISGSAGCTASACITIDDTSCGLDVFSFFPGTLFVNGYGVPPLDILWDDGSTDPFIVTTAGQEYCVTITDAIGCTVDTCVVADSIDFPVDSTCYVEILPHIDSSGQLLLHAYAWSLWNDPIMGGFNYEWNTGDTTASILIDDSGTYCVTITSSMGCVASACIDLDDQSCDIALICDPPGTLTVLPFGIPPYDIVWSNGSTEPTIPVIAGEEYCVTVTDGLGCVSDTCMVVDSIINPIDSFCFVEIWPQLDSNGQLTLVAQAWSWWGSPIGFDYIWNTGDTGSIIIPSANQEYCVTAFSSNNCVATACIDLDDQSCDIGLICDPPGTLTVLPFGIPPYDIIWSNGSTDQTIQVAVGQEYCVTVTDGLGCVSDTCMVVDSFINPVDSFCFVEIWPQLDSNGQLTLVAQAWSWFGIFTDFTYVWNTGDTGNIIMPNGNQEYCVTATSSIGCVSTACFDLSNIQCDIDAHLSAGGILQIFPSGIPPFDISWDNGDSSRAIVVDLGQTYCVTVTDAVNCEVDTCITILSLPVDTFCWAGIVPESTGGDEFLLSAIGYGFTDPVAFEWSNGSLDSIITVAQGSGVHCVTITFENGCTAEACINVDDLGCLSLEISVEDVNSGYQLTAIVPNPQDYYFFWDNGDTSQSTLVTDDGFYCVDIISISDSCYNRACVQVGDFGGNIYGQIIAQDSNDFVPFEGIVYLYQADSIGNYQMVDSTAVELIQGGIFSAYYFDNVDAGIYLCKAVVTPINSSTEFVPTYHLNAITWQEAIPIEISNNLPWADGLIIVQEADNVNGPGTIGGIVSGDANLRISSSRSGDGIGSVPVIITHEDGTPIEHLHTHSDGSFSFENLPFGTYRIYLDYLNISGSYILVTITEDDHDITLNIIMEDGAMYLDSKELAVLEHVKIYPNPVSDFLFIDFGDLSTINAIEVFDMYGRQVLSSDRSHINGLRKINTNVLDDGIYLINIYTEDGIFGSKFVKTRN